MSVSAEKKQEKKILIGTAVSLLAIAAIVLTVISVYSHKKLTERIDNELRRKAEKCMWINQISVDWPGHTDFDFGLEQLVLDGSITSDDGSYAAYLSNGGWIVETGMAPDVPAYGNYYSGSNLEENIGDKAFFAAPLKEIYYEDERTLSSQLNVLLIRDADHDWIIYDNDRFMIQPSELYYSEIIKLSDQNKSYFDLYPLNYESGKHPELKDLAAEYIEEGKESGWKGGYRYYCYEESVLVRLSEEMRMLEYHFLQGDLEEDWNDIVASLEGVGFEQYTLHSVIFHDASSEIKALQIRILILSGVAILICLAVLLILHLLFRRYTMESIAHEGPSGKGTEDDWSVLSEETTAGLLSQIDAAESSMGPNGYLDELRDAIGKLKK